MFIKKKKEKRLENKYKKMAALMNITKLNEQDRKLRYSAATSETSSTNVKANQNESISEIFPPKIKNKESLNSCNKNYNKTYYPQGSPYRKHCNNEKITTDEPPKKQKITQEDYGKLKKEIRDQKQRYKSIPRIRLKLIGENASLNGQSKNEARVPIFFRDVQDLLLYSLLGNDSPSIPSRWCQFEKHNKISHTVVLVIEGLTVTNYLNNKSLFSSINSILNHQLEIVTPTIYGGSIAEELTIVPLTGTQKHCLIQKYGSLKAAMQSTGNLVKLLKMVFPVCESKSNVTKGFLPSTDKFSRTSLLLSPWQMVEENYPVPLKGGLANKYIEYKLTQDEYEEATLNSPMFGLDCEMCRTTSGLLELTRISIVDEKMNLIYNTLVKPDNEIIDYLTPFSGITKEMLEEVTTKLSDVQDFIRILLPPDAILVGQSLNADLHSLKMMHPYVIDTSIIYNMTGDRHRKSKLQTLVKGFLNERIQEKSTGHCSTEDSQACMKLVHLKLANNIEFGDAVLQNQKKVELLESTFSEKPMLSNFTHINNSLALNNKILDRGSRTTAIIGCKDVMNEYSQCLKKSSLNLLENMNFEKSDNLRLLSTDGNSSAVTRCSEIAMENALTFCHVKLEKDQLTNGHVESTLMDVNTWVSKLWKSTALNGLVCVVFSGEKGTENGAFFLNIKKQV